MRASAGLSQMGLSELVLSQASAACVALGMLLLLLLLAWSHVLS
jgi:hypothetical protein